MTPPVPNDPALTSSERRPARCLHRTAACLAVALLLGGNASGQVTVAPAPGRMQQPAASRPAPSGIFPLSVAWTISLEAPHAVPPAYDRDAMFVSLTSGRLVKISLSKGEVEWNADVADARSLGATDGLVLVATGSRVEARDAADGRARWQYPLAGTVSVPLLCIDGWVIVATDASRVLALRARDGALLWEASLAAAAAAQPAVSGAALYVPLAGQRLARLDLADGRQRWNVRLAAQPNVLLALDDRVYAGTADRSFYALRTRDGHVEWRIKRVEVTGQPLADRTRVYFLAFDNSIRGVNLDNGSLEWSRALAHRARVGPIRHDNLLVVSGRSDIAAFTADRGTPSGTFDVAHDLTAPIHLVPGLVTVDVVIASIMTTGLTDQVVAFRPSALDPR